MLTKNRLFLLCFAGCLALGACDLGSCLHRKKKHRSHAPKTTVARADAGSDAGTKKPDAGATPEIPGLRGGGFFFETPDGNARERLATLPIKELKRGFGGRSVAFKITLSDGTMGYYKPEQTFSAAHWWSEVVAYHLDRLLGLNRVPPVVSRRFPWETLRRCNPDDAHFNEVIVEPDGTVKGAFSFWVPDKLVPVTLPLGWERWIRVQPWTENSVSPFQRPRAFTDAIAQHDQAHAHATPPPPTTEEGAAVAVVAAEAPSENHTEEAHAEPAHVAEVAPTPAPQPEVEAAAPQPATNENGPENEPIARAGAAPENPERAAELSDLAVFDFLILNTDRWGGGNANVLTRGGGAIVFLDNAAGMPRNQVRNGLMDSRIRIVQKFRRRTIDAVRAFNIHDLERRLATEPLAPVIDHAELEALEARRLFLLAHIAEMEKQFGDAIYAW